MDHQTTPASTRIHPLMAGAAASVILVSLLGVAAIAGIIPSSHGTASATASGYPASPANFASGASAVGGTTPVSQTRYVTPDGQVFEAVPNSKLVVPVSTSQYQQSSHQPAPVVRHAPTRRYVRNTYSEPVNSYAQNTNSQPPQSYSQANYAPEQHPIRNYVSDMHPVGTGVGAVVGGLLGNQIGGGNGRKIATVAGALLGGYTGNEVAHDRNPLPW